MCARVVPLVFSVRPARRACGACDDCGRRMRSKFEVDGDLFMNVAVAAGLQLAYLVVELLWNVAGSERDTDNDLTNE